MTHKPPKIFKLRNTLSLPRVATPISNYYPTIVIFTAGVKMRNTLKTLGKI
ncbi:hypothetical protein GCM10011338_21150 [Alteromonas lipolytica]|nr:hypothetical protein GCM10011338_21150 [Alteromonas lipolytica]